MRQKKKKVSLQLAATSHFAAALLTYGCAVSAVDERLLLAELVLEREAMCAGVLEVWPHLYLTDDDAAATLGQGQDRRGQGGIVAARFRVAAAAAAVHRGQGRGWRRTGAVLALLARRLVVVGRVKDFATFLQQIGGRKRCSGRKRTSSQSLRARPPSEADGNSSSKRITICM
jgi:hypothetical protein